MSELVDHHEQLSASDGDWQWYTVEGTLKQSWKLKEEVSACNLITFPPLLPLPLLFLPSLPFQFLPFSPFPLCAFFSSLSQSRSPSPSLEEHREPPPSGSVRQTVPVAFSGGSHCLVVALLRKFEIITYTLFVLALSHNGTIFLRKKWQHDFEPAKEAAV